MQDLEGFALGFGKVRVVEGARIFVTRDGALKSASRKDRHTQPISARHVRAQPVEGNA